uniref:Calpain catalytic domain-containing protein n=1 Tax=Globodera rostochiensis TaxID=31243 RepID=A0A914I3H0_GLORO
MGNYCTVAFPTIFLAILLEKAYAKLCGGSYKAINIGSIREALADFTDGITESAGLEPKNKYVVKKVLIYGAARRMTTIYAAFDSQPLGSTKLAWRANSHSWSNLPYELGQPMQAEIVNGQFCHVSRSCCETL